MKVVARTASTAQGPVTPGARRDYCASVPRGRERPPGPLSACLARYDWTGRPARTTNVGHWPTDSDRAGRSRHALPRLVGADPGGEGSVAGTKHPCAFRDYLISGFQ